MREMWYNSTCRGEQNTRALCFLKAAVFPQSNIAGKAPFTFRTPSWLFVSTTAAKRGGRFIMKSHFWDLLNPSNCNEKSIQDAIEEYFGILFPGYRLGKPKGMPVTWRPDIVGSSLINDFPLIIEIKGNPPNGSKQDAINQVIRYAKEFQLVNHNTPVKLAVIGPWRNDEVAVEYCDEQKGDESKYKVGYISISTIAFYLANMAETLLIKYQEQKPETLNFASELDLNDDPRSEE